MFEVSYFDIKENNSGKYEVDSIVLCHKKNRILTWCATRQEDSELLKSFVPPVAQSAGGILMQPHNSFHGIQQESSSEASVVCVPCCSNGYRMLLRQSNPFLK